MMRLAVLLAFLCGHTLAQTAPVPSPPHRAGWLRATPSDDGKLKCSAAGKTWTSKYPAHCDPADAPK